MTKKSAKRAAGARTCRSLPHYLTCSVIGLGILILFLIAMPPIFLIDWLTGAQMKEVAK